MTTYRIVPAEPSAEQIERGRDELWFMFATDEETAAFVRAFYLAMTEQCPEVSGEPVAWALRIKKPRSPSLLYRGVYTAKPTAEQMEFAEMDGDEYVPLYTTPQPEVKDLHQWMAELLQRQQSLPSDISAAMNADPSALMESDETTPQPDHAALLKMLAHRARCFPNFPMGYHLTELFDALGEKPPEQQPDPRDAEIARLKEAARVALEAMERVQRWSRSLKSASMWTREETENDLHMIAAITTLKGVIE